jgi:hypothetical protein
MADRAIKSMPPNSAHVSRTNEQLQHALLQRWACCHRHQCTKSKLGGGSFTHKKRGRELGEERLLDGVLVLQMPRWARRAVQTCRESALRPPDKDDKSPSPSPGCLLGWAR